MKTEQVVREGSFELDDSADKAFLAPPLDFITMSAPRPPSRLWLVVDPRLGMKEPICGL